MGARRERALLHEKLLSEFSKLQVKKKKYRLAKSFTEPLLELAG